MIVNIPLATGNKLNCFISVREMFSNILPCALMLLFVFCFVDFYMLNHLLEKNDSSNHFSTNSSNCSSNCSSTDRSNVI